MGPPERSARHGSSVCAVGSAGLGNGSRPCWAARSRRLSGATWAPGSPLRCMRHEVLLRPAHSEPGDRLKGIASMRPSDEPQRLRAVPRPYGKHRLSLHSIPAITGPRSVPSSALEHLSVGNSSRGDGWPTCRADARRRPGARGNAGRGERRTQRLRPSLFCGLACGSSARPCATLHLHPCQGTGSLPARRRLDSRQADGRRFLVLPEPTPAQTVTLPGKNVDG